MKLNWMSYGDIGGFLQDDDVFQARNRAYVNQTSDGYTVEIWHDSTMNWEMIPTTYDGIEEAKAVAYAIVRMGGVSHERT